ncbi:unnamed protein product [Candidula unifasciata]|uniref:Cytosolic endo-beta-N-acetylglucosaminidase TIM barrel domain-containing protein n=1 Tax=Candidula unifasciata TaxID=100452 RepID=A0A8S3ZB08_9EUPU|nr:unnamed protein product [Candidula unifasciata]
MSIRLDSSGNAVTEPFTKIKDVLDWTPNTFLWKSAALNEAPQRYVGSDLLEQTRKKSSRPQVLVCHDMCGGYLEDRFIHGCSASSAYTFYHWQLIDIFIYFSHNFVTIPPIGWIQAAKKHSVMVLGTIITEWDTGAEICKELLKSEESIDQFTTKLSEMALLHGFDGWLINIENKIESDQVARLLTFVQQLTVKCRHLLNASKVLWYDSVINTGELIWQDELNSLNEMFFTVADGIFLNYCITKEKLIRSKQLSSLFGREFDVFAGVDIFGRSPPAYGGFSTRETLKLILDQGLSCALFAPGWVYEHLGPEQFDSNELTFWGLLSEMLSPRPVEIPFATSFCRGYGDRFYIQGQAVTDGPWYNLSLQQIQPSFTHSQFVAYTVTKVIEPEASEDKQQQEKKQKCTVQVETCARYPACPEMKYDLSVGYLGGGSLRLGAGRMQSVPVLFRLVSLRAHQERSVCVSVIWSLPSETSGHAGVVLSAGGPGQRQGRSIIVYLDTTLSDRHKDVASKTLQDSEGYLEPVHFLTAAKRDIISEEGNWTQWSFDADLSLLLRKDDQEFTLSIILIPPLEVCDGVTSARQMSVHIGHLQLSFKMRARPDKKQLTETADNRQVQLESATAQRQNCVEKSDIEPPVNTKATPENKCQLTETSKSKQVRMDSDTLSQNIWMEKRDLVSNSGNVCGSVWKHTVDLISEASPDMLELLHVLQWESLSSDVHVYLLYKHDEEDVKQCIGHTAESWFVWRQTAREKQVMRFSIKPVMKTCDQKEEVFFYV